VRMVLAAAAQPTSTTENSTQPQRTARYDRKRCRSLGRRCNAFLRGVFLSTPSGSPHCTSVKHSTGTYTQTNSSATPGDGDGGRLSGTARVANGHNPSDNCVDKPRSAR
jgi:hypothetical protein